jgi:predicted DCC family thiol-disulfide oxidoreductase YuxK
MNGNEAFERFIVYDGDCGFCTKWAAKFRDRLQAPVRILPNTVENLAALDVSPEDAARALQWVGPDQRSSAAAAIAAWFSASTLRRWRCAGWLLNTRIVRPLAAAGYRLVARNRGRLS